MNRVMDVKFQQILIDTSLKVADESQGVIRDIFLEQASRLYSELQLFLKTQPKKKGRKRVKK